MTRHASTASYHREISRCFTADVSDTYLQHLGLLHQVVFLADRLVVPVLEQLHLLNYRGRIEVDNCFKRTSRERCRSAVRSRSA